MARTRSQRLGHLYIKGPSWLLRWREDVRDADGNILRARFTRVICSTVDRDGNKITKPMARRIAWDQILGKLDRASMHPQTLATVEEFIRAKFEPQWVWSLKPGGKKHYGTAGEPGNKNKPATGVIKEIIRAIGKLPLRSVTTEVVGAAIRRRLEHDNVSTQTATHLRNGISAVFRHAQALNFFQGENPAHAVRMPEMKRKPQKALNIDQARAVLAALPRRRPPVFEMAYVSISCSLNVAEMIGLRNKYVNLTDEFTIVDGEAVPPRCLFVRENNYRGQTSSPKTKGRVRAVPLSAAVCEQVTQVRAVNVRSGPDDYVFQNTEGGALSETNLARRVLGPIGKQLKLPFNLSWHVFRHTHATLAEILSLPLSDRQANMGHASGKMTLHYTASDIDRRRQGIESISQLLLEPKKEPDQ